MPDEDGADPTFPPSSVSSASAVPSDVDVKREKHKKRKKEKVGGIGIFWLFFFVTGHGLIIISQLKKEHCSKSGTIVKNEFGRIYFNFFFPYYVDSTSSKEGICWSKMFYWGHVLAYPNYIFQTSGGPDSLTSTRIFKKRRLRPEDQFGGPLLSPNNDQVMFCFRYGTVHWCRNDRLLRTALEILPACFF